MTLIHPTALVDARAELGQYCRCRLHHHWPACHINAGTTVGPHCVIEGHTTIGQHNRIFSSAHWVAVPQDKKYVNEPCELIIGDRNTIREFCTFNIGSSGPCRVAIAAPSNTPCVWSLKLSSSMWAFTGLAFRKVDHGRRIRCGFTLPVDIPAAAALPSSHPAHPPC